VSEHGWEDAAEPPHRTAARTAGDPAGAPGRWPGRVMQVLATSTGGVGSHIADIARGLVAGGATVIVCGPAATEDRFGFTATGAGFTPVEIASSQRPAGPRTITGLRRAVVTAAPDLVHAHGLRAGLTAALARTGRPLVVTLHNAVIAGGLRGRASRLVERIVAGSADVVLGASRDLVAAATAAGGRDVRLAPVAAPELPPARRSPAEVRSELGIEPGTPLLLAVGRLAPQKGYEVLVSAAARWRDRAPVPQVVIAGTGPSFAELTARIAAAGAPVTLLGHRRDVADLLAAADLAVVSSVWEARQLFAQEALRAGLPLVGTRVGDLPELVGEAAVLVPPGDVDGLDRAVRDLLDDPAERERLGRLARAQSATWPTSTDTLAQVLGVYAELTGIEVTRLP
jgi:glycosyltransferase involved in cell wall biosynthesis